MQTFVYQARNSAGAAIRGKRMASSADSLANLLFQEGLTPIKIEEHEEKQNSWMELKLKLPFRLVPLTELHMFSRQMYTLNKSGIPIISGVSRLAETTRNIYLQSALRQVVEYLSAGQSLTLALQHHPRIFPSLFVNLVQVGETSGSLDVAFKQIASYLELEEDTTKRVKSALRYPIFVISTLMIVIVVINFMVIPSFSKIFARFHEQLPLPTRILMGTSNFLVHYWQIILLFVTLGIVGFFYLVRRTAKGEWYWHRFQLKMPITGSILKRILLGRFCRTFALILKAGIPVTDGIRLVASAVGNAYVGGNIDGMHEGISRGESLTQAAANTGMFSPLVLQMLTVGEETGRIDESLMDVAEFYEREVDYDLKRLSDLLEPILLIILGAMVLVLALGVFLPIWNMINLVGK